MGPSRSHRLINVINNCVCKENTIQIVNKNVSCFDLSFT